MSKRTFRIVGRVIDRRTRRGSAGLRVEAWDKDLICDDLVGSAITDEQGGFLIEFDESYFQELFHDRRPDLFFRVFHESELIKSTEDSVLWNVETGETEITIEVDVAPVELDEEALSRCGPGIGRLLLMKDEEIIQAKEKDEERINLQLKQLKKENKEGGKPGYFSRDILLRKAEPIPHPVFRPVIIGKLEKIPIKIRAIVNFGGNIDDLRAMGIEVHSHVHDVFTITATKQQIAVLASQPATRRIKLPRKFEYDLDDAGPQAEVDQIHALGTEGDNTIVGVIDSGLNVRHHAFRDPTTHNTRVLYMWVQSPQTGATGDSPEDYFNGMYPPGSNPFIGMNYGIVYDTAAIDTAIGLASSYGTGTNEIAIDPTDSSGHGTHVAGIAAGNGLDASWSQGPNVGAAPEADIVFVATDLDEDHTIDAMNFIFEIAQRQSLPAVVNMSFGSYMGPHDGKSDYDKSEDEMLFSFKGRSLVRTAGNDNNDDGLRRGTINAGQTEPSWDINPLNTSVLVDIWYTGPELNYQLSCGSDSTGWRTSGQGYDSSTDTPGQLNTYDVYVYRDYETRTDKRNILIFIPAAGVDDWTIQLENPGTSVVNYWAWSGTSAQLDSPTFGEYTLGDTACCKSVITVGGCDKPVGANPEMIADYSGCGPTLDGRIKPEITAIGTSVNSASAATDTTYVGMTGTSQASPMVAGSAALLLSNDSDLNQDAIKGLLTQTADQTDLDIDPGEPTSYDPLERNAYGYGRLRMLAPFEHSFPLVDVDVWVRTADDDYGFEPYPGGCFCHAPEVKVLDSTGTEITTLNWGDEHRVQVRVHNLGDTPAMNTRVKLKYTRPWAAPDDWVPCQDPSNDPIEEVINVPALDYYDLEFSQRWKPEAGELPPGGAEWGDHYCLLVELNDPSHPDDPLNYDDSTAEGRDPWIKNIKGTNNVALRNLHIH